MKVFKSCLLVMLAFGIFGLMLIGGCTAVLIG